MLYEKIPAMIGSFRPYEEHMKLGCGASIACFVVAIMLFTAIFKPYPYPILFIPGFPAEIIESIPGNFTTSRSEVYELNGDIRIHGNSSTILVSSDEKDHHTINKSWTTRPYARKQDEAAMNNTKIFTIIKQSPGNKSPQCGKNLSQIPAVVFSTGGYAGNHFHDFSDVLIPLYLTSRRFNLSVVFLISDMQAWWNIKYRLILHNLSKYEPIDIDREDRVLCFSRTIVGLIAQKEFSIDPVESPYYSASDFRRFLHDTYSLQRDYVARNSSPPRLLMLSREKTRRLINEDAVLDMARRLGFDVTVEETGLNMSYVSKLVNSFDAMMGVHGAGLTNMVFLPENALVIQIVPFGVDILANADFEEPAKDMKLRYLNYKVSLRESSLLGKYPVDSEFYRDPAAVYDKGWDEYRSIYLDDQDLNLDLNRFRQTLVEAMKLICS